MKRLAAWILVAGGLAGCKQSNGTTLGLYNVQGERHESCGDAGVLGSTPAINWRVHLRRVGTSALHWNAGDGLIIGQVDDQDRFALSQFNRVDMRQGDMEQPSCQVDRLLTIEGAMWGATGGYEGFEGTLRNDYALTEGSSCDDVLDALGGELPCSVIYELEGERE
jgi:hypothetical protein